MTPVPYGASPIFVDKAYPTRCATIIAPKQAHRGLLRMLEGEVRLVFVDPPSEQLVTPDRPRSSRRKQPIMSFRSAP